MDEILKHFDQTCLWIASVQNPVIPAVFLQASSAYWLLTSYTLIMGFHCFPWLPLNFGLLWNVLIGLLCESHEGQKQCYCSSGSAWLSKSFCHGVCVGL